jgi:hypothetical protein
MKRDLFPEARDNISSVARAGENGPCPGRSVRKEILGILEKIPPRRALRHTGEAAVFPNVELIAPT